MILMYHHVCPSAEIPTGQAPLEGWKYNIEPTAFQVQLQTLLKLGRRFVSLDEYLAELQSGSTSQLVTVTFDDGWVDNLRYAFPILSAMGLPSTLFVVSGDMAKVSGERRLNANDLRSLRDYGVTVGAHTRTHPNLAQLRDQELIEELGGCKADLEDLLGAAVKYLAYPGGRFNRRVVEVTQQVGFHAACSVISWGFNTEASRFWLYRDVFSDQMNCWSDRLRLNRWSRSLLSWKAGRSLRRMLAHG
jgi:peptidoglycan/xylan/chitin deacetylase (PgdA/CDA1 family)